MRKKIIARLRNFLLPTFIIFTVCSIFLLLSSVSPSIFNKLLEEITQHWKLFSCLRWLIIFSFILCWRYLVVTLGHRMNATHEHILALQKGLWRFTAWLIIFEVLVCENFLWKALRLLGL